MSGSGYYSGAEYPMPPEPDMPEAAGGFVVPHYPDGQVGRAGRPPDPPDLPALPGGGLNRADFISQSTAIEQARAIAEVQGAIIVAQNCPRIVDACVAAIRESCAQRGMADVAFFSYPRGEGKPITGPTIHLAREVARCWGNIDYGIGELRRDTLKGESEMRAWAWDQQTNTRVSTTFLVPHARDTKKGVKPIVDLRDIYENNANMGGRRVRAQIFAVIPRWITDLAQTVCMETLERTEPGAPPLPRRIADQIDWWAGKHGVSRQQLEDNRGRSSGEWTPLDLAQLAIVARSISIDGLTVAEAFPPPRVTNAEIAEQAKEQQG